MTEAKQCDRVMAESSGTCPPNSSRTTSSTGAALLDRSGSISTGPDDSSNVASADSAGSSKGKSTTSNLRVITGVRSSAIPSRPIQFNPHSCVSYSGKLTSPEQYSVAAGFRQIHPQRVRSLLPDRASLAASADDVQIARSQGLPELSLINAEELARIEELIAANTFPDRWDSTEHRGNEWLREILPGGSVQLLSFNEI